MVCGMFQLLGLAALVGALAGTGSACGQGQPELFSYPVNLDPDGGYWVVLRSLPSALEGVRDARIGPHAFVTETGRIREWVHVRLPGGVGWMAARYVGCGKSLAFGQAPPRPTTSCDDIWYQRNAIFASAPDCFRTPRGVNAFGSAGCLHESESDVPLSSNPRARIADLRSSEQALGCVH